MYLGANDQDAVIQAVTSVGLAGLAYRRGAPELLMKARRTYGRTLHLTSLSLECPERATEDQTLATTILLALYEVSSPKECEVFEFQDTHHMLQTINCTTPSALQSWDRHLWGALRLLELRGESQLGHQTGMELFSHLRGHVVRQTPVSAWCL